MKITIIPSLIAKTQEELDGILSKINDSAQLLQLDIKQDRE